MKAKYFLVHTGKICRYSKIHSLMHFRKQMNVFLLRKNHIILDYLPNMTYFKNKSRNILIN